MIKHYKWNIFIRYLDFSKLDYALQFTEMPGIYRILNIPLESKPWQYRYSNLTTMISYNL